MLGLIRVLLLLLLLFAGTTSAQAGKDLESLVLQLKWLHQFQFAGYYAALEKGFFAEEGLDVTLRERDLSQDNILQVLEGDADYGIADSILLLFKERGRGVVLVAPIFQHSPNVLMTLASSDIHSPKDLVGRRLAFYDNDTEGINILAMLARQGVLDQGMIREPFNLDERLENLLAGRIDAATAYATNEPVRFREAGHAIRVLDPRHYGVDFYGDILFTHQQEAAHNPQRVAAMRRAVIRGWEYALDHKEEIVDLILEKYNTQNKTRAALLQEARGLELFISRHTVELGQLDRGRLDFMLELLDTLDFLEYQDTSLEKLVFESTPNSHSNLHLSEEQWAWLDSLESIRVATDPNWPPFEYYNEQGQLRGISADYLKLLEERLGVRVELVHGLSWLEVLEASRQGEIDLLPAVAATPARRDFLSFSRPYVRSPMVLVTDMSIDFIAGVEQLKNRKILTVTGYASDETLGSFYPNLKVERVNSTLEGLQRVAAGEAEVFVGNLAAVSYLIRSEGLANLKVSGQLPHSFDLAMAVRNDLPQLVEILDHFLASVSAREHNEIYATWVKLPVQQGIPWRNILPILISLLALLGLLGFYAAHLTRLNRRIRLAEAELRSKNRELKQVSITDKLTGCYNRHHLDKVLLEQAELVRRHQRPLALVLFDLDHFKRLNDTHGHQMGDEVLHTFAELVRGQVRSTDVFGRWGGEEFLLICPETDQKQACQVAEKIRKVLEEHEFPQGIRQTLSAGVLSLKQEMSLDQLLSEVDEQLYRAKQQGRNRVCC